MCVGEEILDGFHLLGDIEFFEDVSVAEETDVEVLEEIVESVGLGLHGVGDEIALDVDDAVEVVAENVGDAADDH